MGRGGRGFNTIVALAGRRLAVTLGGDRSKLRAIAVGDLIEYLVGVRDEPRAVGQRFDVGSDDVLSIPEMVDAVAEILRRPRPAKVRLPLAPLRAAAPLIERLGRLPRGAFRGFIDALRVDAVGDPTAIQALLPRPLLSFREAAERALSVA